MNDYSKGGFTLPGEAGYEALTLKMAEKWGADVIRDSDGTKLSPEITEAGYRIYSTICIIREHNEFARSHPDAQQQTFLFSEPQTALSETLVIHPLDGYFDEQFEINDSAEAMAYWQVWDRTENRIRNTAKTFTQRGGDHRGITYIGTVQKIRFIMNETDNLKEMGQMMFTS